jgi:hypothetical protein
VRVPEFDYAVLRTLTEVVDHVELYSNDATSGLPRCRGPFTPQVNRLRPATSSSPRQRRRGGRARR